MDNNRYKPIFGLQAGAALLSITLWAEQLRQSRISIESKLLLAFHKLYLRLSNGEVEFSNGVFGR